jgi:hypothetical protein
MKSDRLPEPTRLARRGRRADARVADAFGQDYDEYNEGWGDWMWRKGSEAGQALNQPLEGEDLWDLMRSVPSAATRIGENFLGQLGDVGDMKYQLARLINDKLKGSSGMDMGLDLSRAQNFDQSSLPTSEGLHETAKRKLPGALTYEPQGPLGSALHVGADFIDPMEMGAGGVARGLARRLR